MIGKREAHGQIARMTGLDFFPLDELAVDELVQALATSDTEEIAKYVVDDWLAGQSSRPTPADLHRIVSDENQRRKPQRLGFTPNPKNWDGDLTKLSAEQLDNLPSFLSGLPTNPKARAEALDAWRTGGPKGLNDWRNEKTRRMEKAHVY